MTHTVEINDKIRFDSCRKPGTKFELMSCCSRCGMGNAAGAVLYLAL